MKKSLLRIISALLLRGILPACTPTEEANTMVPSDTTADNDIVQTVFEATSTPTPEAVPTEEALQRDADNDFLAPII